MDQVTPYEPPRVWKDEPDQENQFSKTNRPIAGPTHEHELPVGVASRPVSIRAAPINASFTMPSWLLSRIWPK